MALAASVQHVAIKESLFCHWLMSLSQCPSCPYVPVYVQGKTSSSPSRSPPVAPHGVADVAFCLRCDEPTNIHQETCYPWKNTRTAAILSRLFNLALHPFWLWDPIFSNCDSIHLSLELCKLHPRETRVLTDTRISSHTYGCFQNHSGRSPVLSASSLLSLLPANRE